MAAKQKNDNKDSELGNSYRSLIALSYCIGLEKGEKVVIEKYGDVSYFGKSKNIQIEVKHHISPNSLSDGHEELWKTLLNWHENDSSQFDELILHTTSHLPTTSPLAYWHSENTDADVRHYILQHSCKSKAKEYKRIHSLIFNDALHPKSKRKEIFSKIELKVGEPNYEEKLNILKDNSFFSWIKEDELKTSVIIRLLGEINALNEPGKDWEITREVFDGLIQGIKYIYDTAPSSLVLDTHYRKAPIENDKIIYQDKPFVKAIECLSCDKEEIDEAIIDYWRFNMAFNDFIQVHPTFNINTFQHYKKEIVHLDIKRLKRSEISNNEGRDNKSISLNIFRKAVQLPIKEYGLLRPNADYFQRGTMHDIVEDGDFKWIIE